MTGLTYGYYPDMLNVFAEKLNFTYREFHRKDDVWARIDPITKEWSGMIKNLADGDVDLVSGNFVHLRNRAEVVDFLQALNVVNLGFAIRGLYSFDQGLLKLLWTVYSEGKLQSCLKLRNFQNPFSKDRSVGL